MQIDSRGQMNEMFKWPFMLKNDANDFIEWNYWMQQVNAVILSSVWAFYDIPSFRSEEIPD